MSDNEYHLKLRSLDEINRLGIAGRAFRLHDGSFDLPCDSYSDLRALVDAAEGLEHGDTEQEIRRFLIDRARIMGHSQVLPMTWNSDGTYNDAGSSFRY